MSEVTAIRRNYQLYYDIGPLPRDLACLDYAPRACIEGEFRLSDGETKSYRLEGSTDPCATAIAVSNSFLTTWHIWDAFLEEFTAVQPQFRFLRYNQRSYTPDTGSALITIDVLTDDLKELLDGLLIASANTVIGVSLGGATALNFALKYTPRLTRFVACDFAAISGPNAADAWGARVALAQQGMEKLVLANVKRWFLPENVRTESGRHVLRMVQENNFDGFKKGTNALIHLDLEP
jgi:pimeloyl-ACP methyl ester carboxylesterase